jgi:methanogenic corrinoid protein MtbC1
MMHATNRVECREILYGGALTRGGASYGEVAVGDVRHSNKSARASALERSSAEASRARGRNSSTRGAARRNRAEHDSCAPEANRITLARTIEGEIIPRLLILHRGGEPGTPHRLLPGDSRLPGPEEIDDFARMIIVHDVPVASAYVSAVRERGLSLETVCLELLAPAARRLGELWETDQCDFTQVTVGLWRLQQVLHGFDGAFEATHDLSGSDRRILLSPAPGDQHTFGLIMVAEFFRRAHWYVCSNVEPSTQALAATLKREHFDVLGLSLGSEVRLQALREAIATLRRASRNKGLIVMVGGAPFLAAPERGEEVGADVVAGDARDAPAQAAALLPKVARKARR